MSLQQWAEQVFFGTQMADKLVTPPVGLHDVEPGPALQNIPLPGRPDCLPLIDNRRRASFPGRGALVDARARGKVLHFFANHELLALELMALVLLRFPTAPRSFRRGLANTMLEEQRHLSLYLNRMDVLGVSLGEIPVNDFFWRCLSSVETPAEFVAGMSLTFEQANLDFSLAYRDAFAEVGDRETADLMQEVYDDEVGHVRHGLRWMRRWAPEGHSEWSTHTNLLRFPLTPARARGTPFRRDARRAAGLPDAYIDQLELFRHSRGRPPQVFVFNPGSEEEMVLGPQQHLPAAALQVQRDLEMLPALLAGEDDVVLVQQAPSMTHLRVLKQAGLAIPEFVTFNGTTLQDHALCKRTLGALQPWGWSPHMAALLGPLGAQWHPQHKTLAGKSTALRPLKTVLSSGEPWLASPQTAGCLCTDADAVFDAVSRLHEAGAQDVVIKAEWGAAGRGAIRLLEGRSFSKNATRWLHRILQRQGRVVVEPWLDRVMDFSMHFDRQPDGTMRPTGMIRMCNDARGQYRGHHLGRMTDGLDSAVIQMLYGGGKDARRLSVLTAQVGQAVGDVLVDYVGPVGVDALVYRDHRQQSFRIKPIVEINPRWSMGRVAIALRRRVQPGLSAWFALLDPQAVQHVQRQVGPLQFGKGGLWSGGCLCLTPGTSLQAVVVIGAAVDGLTG